jgi:hypothetical protein
MTTPGIPPPASSYSLRLPVQLVAVGFTDCGRQSAMKRWDLPLIQSGEQQAAVCRPLEDQASQ